MREYLIYVGGTILQENNYTIEAATEAAAIEHARQLYSEQYPDYLITEVDVLQEALIDN